jgi:hypothetical protein
VSTRLLRNTVVTRLPYLIEQVTRFETFHIGNAKLALNDFCDLFTTDDVLGQIWESLRPHLDLSAKGWYEEANRSGQVPALPTDPTSCMAFRFAALRLVRRQKVDLKHFVTNLFLGAHLNERLMHWKRLIVHPFAADCRAIARDLPGLLPDTEWVLLTDVLPPYLADTFPGVAFGPRAWTDADDEAEEALSSPQPAEAADPDPLRDALGALKTTVQSANLGPSLRADLVLDIRALQQECERPTFLRERFLARLDSVAQHEALSASCAAVQEALP